MVPIQSKSKSKIKRRKIEKEIKREQAFDMAIAKNYVTLTFVCKHTKPRVDSILVLELVVCTNFVLLNGQFTC